MPQLARTHRFGSVRYILILVAAGLVMGLALPVPSQTNTVLASNHTPTVVPCDTPTVVPSNPDTPTVVPSNWPLIPPDLEAGDEFRLLAKTKNPSPAQTEEDIDVYNCHVQEQVETRGHRAVQAYADSFRVLGSTLAMNARTNTGTTGSGGPPIYWLNGALVANNNADFYDGTWRNKNSGRGVAGDLIAGTSASGRQLLCTGTADDGTTTDLPLGGGDPDGDGVSECTATSIAVTSNTLGGKVLAVSERARYLALSGVFRVESATVPQIEEVSITSDPGEDTDDPGEDDEYTVGDEIQITVEFSEAVTVTGNPRMVFRVDALKRSDRLEVVERNRKAKYDAAGSSPTGSTPKLVFAYTVRAGDFDKNGIRVKANSLDLNGGTIRNVADDTDAAVSHKKIKIQSLHRIHVPAKATRTEVVSTPSVGTSYATGEIITIQVTFDKDVKVVITKEEGDPPDFVLLFGVPHNAEMRHAAYARVVDGTKVQFDYMVQAADCDPGGFEAMAPAIF